MWLSENKQQKRRLTQRQGETLLDLAYASIQRGLRKGRHNTLEDSFLTTRTDDLPDALRQQGVTFVTLRLGSALRGCMGSVKPQHALAQDVIKNAFNSAFHDPRFAPLYPDEYSELSIQISVLSEFETVDFVNQAELLSQIRKDTDGLLLEFGAQRGLLLPSVWKDILNKQQFLQHLKIKAGLQPEFWSDQIKIQRFTTQVFSR